VQIVKQSLCSSLFDGFNYAGATLTILAGVGAILLAAHPGWLPLVLAAYLAGQWITIVAAAGKAGVRFTARSVAALLGLHILLSWWDVIALVLGLPAILLTMILGPLATVVWVLASVVVGIYAIEQVIGYDLQGVVSVLETPFQALLALGVWCISLGVLWWHLGTHDSTDWAIERAGALIWNVRRRLQEGAEDILQQG
jgi:hypothetical protein